MVVTIALKDFGYHFNMQSIQRPDLQHAVCFDIGNASHQLCSPIFDLGHTAERPAVPNTAATRGGRAGGGCHRGLCRAGRCLCETARGHCGSLS